MPGKDSKGTFNPGTGSVSTGGSAGASAPPGVAAALPPLTEVDATRATARRRLEESYENIAATAWSFVEAVREFRGCAEKHPGDLLTARCASLPNIMGKLAMSIAASMEDAEDAARQGWLVPGDVRAMRERYGMSSSFWDELVRLVHQHRR